MGIIMENLKRRVIKHEIKLEKSVKFLLVALTIGIFVNAFAPAFTIKDAIAELISGNLSVIVSGSLSCDSGCN